MGSSKRHHDPDSDHDDRKRHHKKSKHSSSSSSLKLPSSIPTINKDDYFEKSNEFRIWLKDKKHKYFTDLDADDARYYFKKFVKAWNAYELDEKYYKGINSSHLEASDTTSYKWSFAKNLDAFEMDRIKYSVDSMTAGTKKPTGGSSSQAAPSAFSGSASASSTRRRRPAGPSMPSAVDQQLAREEEHDRRRQAREADRRGKNREFKEYVNDTVPKLDGREARLAEKRATNAMRRQEPSMDVELNDSDLYGGDDFKAQLARERQRNESRQARRQQAEEQKRGPMQERLSEFKSKEAATMAMFRALADQQKQRGGL
ncbi:hypothetical protein DM01DRAFT_1386132 [Hesseltinella vesiculosa]|uniref:Uncharacterized protein n=1 Tax=Hesseltinella vesiculosa TaxID=101127 RepID=A0A1X2G762_9FUNG|nr:hypothetical protein DM01DRAFT_1386132 [Hesseltinella vesiculosa]